MNTYTLDEQRQIEKAITFMVASFNASNHNPKPVILHTINVFSTLYDAQVSVKALIGGILHDLVEDTDVNIEEIEEAFGKDIAELVSVMTFKEEIADYTARYREHFKRILEFGAEAIQIKAADLIDNANYYHLAGDKEKLVRQKHLDFIDLSRGKLANHILEQKLLNSHESNHT